MDIRQRQAMRKRKRRKQRRMVAMGAALVLVLIAVLCITFSCDKEVSVDPEPSPSPVVEQTTEPLPTETPKPETAAEFVSAMSLDDKLMQLFIVTADSLTGVENSTLYGGKTKAAVTQKPVGGVVYRAGNIEGKNQLASMISNTQKQYIEENGFPFFAICEEEGGKNSPVAEKIGGNVGNMSQFADGENFGGAENAGSSMAKYLKAVGFNMNLAPSLKISDNEESFGSDAETVSSMATAFGGAMKSGGIIPVYKTFPSNTLAMTVDELKGEAMLPFEMAIMSGAEAVMVSAEAVPSSLGVKPCYTSSEIVTDLLRNELDFDGLIITAPLKSDDGVISAVMAGCDMLLMPKDLNNAVSILKGAVERGEIGEERINQSIERILKLKLGV